MSSHYMLIVGDTTDVGATVPNIGEDGQANPAVGDPRAMPVTDALEDRTSDNLIDMIDATGPRAVRVARVTPLGAVRPHREFYGDEDTEITGSTVVEADGGWKIEEFEPLTTILGPQAEHILAVIAHGRPVFEDDKAQVNTHNAYVDACEDLMNRQPSTHALEATREAAADALGTVGADEYWWGNGLSCAWGFEMIALAARDLIGTVDGWDQAAYRRLTGPWRTAFPTHPLHPEDAVLAPVAG